MHDRGGDQSGADPLPLVRAGETNGRHLGGSGADDPG